MLADVQQLEQAVAKLATTALWPLSDDELVACLQSAHRLEQAVAAMQASLVHQAATRELPVRQGRRTTAGWLSALLRLDGGPARELADRATALAQHPATEEALLHGQVDARQAKVIASAVSATAASLTDLDPDQVGDAVDIVRRAETTMIEMAGRLPAYQLTRVGERILAHVAPDLADRAEEAVLARQDEHVHRARGFTLSHPENGAVRLSGLLGAEDAALVQAALLPLCGPIAEDERRPAQRRADALVEVCRLALRTGELPHTGGEPAQLAVTVAYDPLTKALGTATTETGIRLPAEAARRLACDARILPAVLSAAGQVLDLGRTHRFPTPALRRALTLRDRGCAFPDCDRPARWTGGSFVTFGCDGY